MRMMSQKDYKAIGKAIYDAGLGFIEQEETKPSHLVYWITQNIADVFERDNPNFDRERFIRFVETGVDK
jgi:hypothetical protein